VKILKAIGVALAALVLLVVAVFVGARFSDGPLAIVPGGPLRSGEWVEADRVDWSFAADVEEIEFESGGRSRTTWVVVHEGEAYIPCSLGFPPGKSWHHEILEDPDGVLRVEGKRYARRFVRVEDEGLKATLAGLARSKYPAPPGGGSGGFWFFHVQPRQPESRAQSPAFSTDT